MDDLEERLIDHLVESVKLNIKNLEDVARKKFIFNELKTLEDGRILEVTIREPSGILSDY